MSDFRFMSSANLGTTSAEIAEGYLHRSRVLMMEDDRNTLVQQLASSPQDLGLKEKLNANCEAEIRLALGYDNAETVKKLIGEIAKVAPDVIVNSRQVLIAEAKKHEDSKDLVAFINEQAIGHSKATEVPENRSLAEQKESARRV